MRVNCPQLAHFAVNREKVESTFQALMLRLTLGSIVFKLDLGSIEFKLDLDQISLIR